MALDLEPVLMDAGAWAISVWFVLFIAIGIYDLVTSGSPPDA
jgi:hypothetical protein